MVQLGRIKRRFLTTRNNYLNLECDAQHVTLCWHAMNAIRPHVNTGFLALADVPLGAP
jgi:hypothetical protein